MVWFLNELRAGEPDLGESLEAFEADLESARRWLERESAYSLHEQEARQFENIRFLWERVDRLLEEADREQLEEGLPPLLFEAALLMEKVTRERDAGHFSPLPAVNRMVLAGAAWIQGRGSREAAGQRLAVLEEFQQNMRRMYTRLRSDLPKENRPDVDLGMRHLKSGIEAARTALEAGDKEALHEALSEVHAGASLVQFLLDWDRREMELLAETYRRFNVPVIGPQLESELEAARRAPRETWMGPAETTLTVSLPGLDAFWERAQSTLLLPPELRQPLLAATDEAIGGLYEAYQKLLDPQSPDKEAIAVLEQALCAASEAFTAVQQAALKAQGADGALARAYVDAIRGIAGGTVPDVTLASMLSDDPPPGDPDVRRLIQEYLAGGHPDALYQAVEIMLDSLPRTPDQSSTEISCPFCGVTNSLAAQLCRDCGGRLSLIGQGWEG